MTAASIRRIHERYPQLFYFYSAASGFLFSLGVPSKSLPHFFLLPLVSLTVLFLLLWEVLKRRKPLLPAVALTAVFILAHDHLYLFIIQTAAVFMGLPKLFSWLLFFVMCFMQLTALWPTLAGLLWGYRRHQGRSAYFIFIAALFTAFESLEWQLGPIRVGHVFLEIAPRLPLAPYFGAGIYTFASVLFALCASWGIHSKKLPPTATALTVFIVTLNFALPPLSPVVRPRESVRKTLNVRFMQTQSWTYFAEPNPEAVAKKVRETIQGFIDWSFKLPKPDLILWPENVVPLPNPRPKSFEEFRTSLPSWMVNLSIRVQTPILAGMMAPVPDTADYENKVFLLDRGEIKQHSSKMKLIPFAEKIPLRKFFADQRIVHSDTEKDYPIVSVRPGVGLKGGTTAPLYTVGRFRFVSPICYEVLFSSLFIDWLRNETIPIDFIVNPSNDGWAGDTTSRIIHLWLLRWRAVESGLPLVRVARTGISALVRPDGSLESQIPYLESGYKDVVLDLPERPKVSLYWKIGETLWWFSIFASLLSLLFREKKQRRS